MINLSQKLFQFKVWEFHGKTEITRIYNFQFHPLTKNKCPKYDFEILWKSDQWENVHSYDECPRKSFIIFMEIITHFFENLTFSKLSVVHVFYEPSLHIGLVVKVLPAVAVQVPIFKITYVWNYAMDQSTPSMLTLVTWYESFKNGTEFADKSYEAIWFAIVVLTNENTFEAYENSTSFIFHAHWEFWRDN